MTNPDLTKTLLDIARGPHLMPADPLMQICHPTLEESARQPVPTCSKHARDLIANLRDMEYCAGERRDEYYPDSERASRNLESYCLRIEAELREANQRATDLEQALIMERHLVKQARVTMAELKADLAEALAMVAKLQEPK